MYVICGVFMYNLCHVYFCLFSVSCVWSVDEGAIIDAQFSHFYHEPPEGFEEIMIEKSLL